jgi:hypothetical protein
VHLINGLYDAHRSMAPVIALAAHIPSSEIGTGYFQETHPDRLFAECSHYSELISNPEQMPRLLQTAIQHAVGRSGVAVVSLPGDIAARDAPERASELALVTRRPARNRWRWSGARGTAAYGHELRGADPFIALLVPSDQPGRGMKSKDYSGRLRWTRPLIR